ncbi:MAG: hypothetical protein RIQ78_34 [Bacteroidota bacterium]|jgi:uncharacterized protein (DUF2141 family)
MLSLILWFLNPGVGVDLHLTISNIQQPTGHVFIAVYDNEAAFLQIGKMRDHKIIPVHQKDPLHITFPQLPPGSYAISCFHDLNGNGKLDTNLVGIPTEPYGFSNNARPKFRAPTWMEAIIYCSTASTQQTIQLDKW